MVLEPLWTFTAVSLVRTVTPYLSLATGSEIDNKGKPKNLQLSPE